MARGASVAKIVILLAFDILLTTMIYTFMYLVGVMIIMKLNHVNMAVSDLVLTPIFAVRIWNDLTEIAGLASWISPMFISSFTTSVWLWVFGVSVFITKVLRRSSSIVEYLKEALDIENRPIYSVGLVMVAVWAVLYGGFVISFLGYHLLSE
jgi:hypothetical protein